MNPEHGMLPDMYRKHSRATVSLLKSFSPEADISGEGSLMILKKTSACPSGLALEYISGPRLVTVLAKVNYISEALMN